jgi:hypothetical protein
MTELQRRFVRRWPVAVLAVAGVAAVSLGDVFAGWNSLAGRGPSAAGEYPVRVVLPVPPASAEDTAEALPADAPEAVDQVPADTGDPAAADGEALAGDRALAETARPALRPGESGLLPVEFDLADPGAFGSGDGGSAIELRKAVRLNGADAGDARIRVSGSSTLSIAREELGRLLARSGQRELVGQMGSGGQFVSFEEMRRQGIEVRYDPVSDRILVST